MSRTEEEKVEGFFKYQFYAFKFLAIDNKKKKKLKLCINFYIFCLWFKYLTAYYLVTSRNDPETIANLIKMLCCCVEHKSRPLGVIRGLNGENTSSF